jgi:predicted O-methyltransferase YrrM
MTLIYQAPDWSTYKTDFRNPHKQIEPLDQEVSLVESGIKVLHEAGVLPHTRYDGGKFLAHRQAVAERFEIPWTAITPRMQRLIYAINAIKQPANMIACGVFCGNTFISNAGAAVGPGACYQANHLIGIEIKPGEAERAARNVAKVDPQGRARIVADDAVHYVAQFPEPIDLLYLDADGTKETGKGVYLHIVEAGLDRLPAGAVVLAHNSINCADKLKHYLAFVRSPRNFRESVNMMVDGEGLEVSVR